MGMLPGIAKMKNQMADANIDDKVIKRQIAIINSMTPKERRNPDMLKASRKKRIAAGSGAKVEEVNRLLKTHRQMADMMKMMGRRKARRPWPASPTCSAWAGGGHAVARRCWRQLKAAAAGQLPGHAAACPAGGRHARGSAAGSRCPEAVPGLPGLGDRSCPALAGSAASIRSGGRRNEVRVPAQ